MKTSISALVLTACLSATAQGSAWDRVGPRNIFNAYSDNGQGPLPMGEGGTLAGAASLSTSPNIIYAGGQNNGVSSGVIKTTDYGMHWVRKSAGMFDTRVLGVWVHPDEPDGSHVFVGTHSGIYESTDGAETWKLRQETAQWGNVMSFREGMIQGKPYILANCGNGGIATMPRGGGVWSYIKAPGPIAPNAHLSVVVNPDNQGTEVLTCIGNWGGGKLFYASIDSATNATWDGPLSSQNETYPSWNFFPGQSQMYGKCQTPTSCNPGVVDLGVFGTLEQCQAAVNSTTKLKVASYTYQHNISSLGAYAGHCYAMSTLEWAPQPQANVDSGRAPGVFPGMAYDCANAAVDPKDRNHFLFSKAGEYRAWESKDGGKSATEFTNHNTGVYFVMIDQQGWLYTATQAGAFVSMNQGSNWSAYHVFMQRKDGSVVDRVPHDYQNIVPDFRGTGVAFPSDQGLHIVNGTELNLTSAVGDMANNMILSALIAPNKDGSRNLVCNIWDWDVVASWDDGLTWAGWNRTEASPGQCGEGGGGQGMGASGKLVMFHRNHWWFSSDGGHNFKMGNLPGVAGSFDYVRQAGSRTEPSGVVFSILDAPPGNRRVGDHDHDHDHDHGRKDGHDYNPMNDDEYGQPDDPEEEFKHEMDPWLKPYEYNPGLLPDSTGGNIKYLMTSTDFGNNWTWHPLPDDLQPGGLSVDPTCANSLFVITANCLSQSKDQGKSWSDCSTAPGLAGSFSKLLIKDSLTMFMLRTGAVPLRTKDGGASWQELENLKNTPLFKYGATMDGSLSWSGNTFVLTGNDQSAIGRKSYGTYVWKSVDGGDTWTDETGDLVTISPGPGVWYEKDFYFVTRGEGLTVKRGFEA